MLHIGMTILPHRPAFPRFTLCEFSLSCKGDGMRKGLYFLDSPHPMLIRVIIVNFYILKLYYLDSLPLFYYVLYYDIFIFIVILSCLNTWIILFNFC